MMMKHNFRLILIGTGLTMCSISDGYIFGQTSGMINALQSQDSSILLNDDDISWIASSINILCIFGFVCMGAITEYLGRKKAITIINIPVVATWILVYFARNKLILIFSRVILGVCFGGIIFLVFITIGEYKPPKIRPLCINLIMCVGGLIGTTLGHVLSIVIHWRYVALIGIIPSGLAALLPFFWVESPAWLASKGRFDECEKAFRALHPPNEITDAELKLLLTYEKTKQKELSRDGSKLLLVNKYMMALSKKYFWKIFILSTVICTYRIASGRIFFSTLALTILQDITGTSDILLFTLIIDGFTTIAAVFGCFILKNNFKIRHILFISGVLANICLVVFAFSLYFCPNNDYYSSWIKIFLLVLYFMIVTAGPCPILDLLMSEIYPLDIKIFISVIIGATASILQCLNIKFAVLTMTNIGYHCIFFVNAGTIFLCLMYMWFFLPETRGRSISEIEFYFKNGTYDFHKVLFNTNQTNDLLNKK